MTRWTGAVAKPWTLGRGVPELQPLIDVRISFLLNILRMNGQNLTKFCIHINIDKIYVWIVNRHLSQI